MANSSQKRKFPLSQYRRSGNVAYWCKKVRGRRIYFERITNDPTGEKSLAQWLDQKPALEAGDEPGRKRANSGLTVKDLCNHWMTHQEREHVAGEISKRTFDEYHKTCKLLLESVRKEREVSTLASEDFAEIRSHLVGTYNPNGVRKHMVQVRSMLKFAFDEDLIEVPVRYGRSFELPSAKTLRRVRNEKGRMDFTREEILAMLVKPTVTQRAMILLGVNAALGNSDVADLPKVAVNLESGWLEYPRTKTETDRRINLWPETVEAIQNAIDARPAEGSPYLFVSKNGQDYTDEERTGWRVTGEFRQVLKRASIESRGRGFYGLRRTFQTQAEQCYDLVAVKCIMGHTFREDDMSARYRQVVGDDRLRRPTDTVRAWLFGVANNE